MRYATRRNVALSFAEIAEELGITEAQPDFFNPGVKKLRTRLPHSMEYLKRLRDALQDARKTA